MTASVSVRTRSGAAIAISCAIAPPMEHAEQVEGVELERVGERERVAGHVGDLVGPVGHRRAGPTSRLSKITVRCAAEKAGTWGSQASVSADRPMTQSSGSPSPWTS